MPDSPLLKIESVSKSFPGVRALEHVSMDLHEGEVLALMGENGAGKSTLIKILGGAQLRDEGEIRIHGEPVHFAHPVESQQAGIGVIYQEFNLVPDMSVRENLFLGREQTRRGMTRQGRESAEARAVFERLGMPINPESRCRDLTIAAQQMVEIGRALIGNARIIIMDEPTAALTDKEVTRLLEIVRELKVQGIGILYVSHRLDEIFEVADRVAVLRDGRSVGDADVDAIDRDRLIEMMVGRPLNEEFPARPKLPGDAPVRLRVEGLRRGKAVRDVSFHLRAGEVLGLAGLVGAGRTETARLIFGADRADTGRIELDGKPIRVAHPVDAIRQGICLLTEDRKAQGLILMHSVLDNFGLPNLRELSTGPFVDLKAEQAGLQRYVDSLRMRISSPDQLAGNLSGGNQQKVVLAKWLQRNAGVVIFDEPTRGIDVGAKYEIYLLINELVSQGKSVLMISSELPELIGMCDRILMMHEGRICGEVENPETVTQEEILAMAIASSDPEAVSA